LDEVQNFQLAPNPVVDSLLKITYLLPQNLPGVFEFYDLNGKLLYTKITTVEYVGIHRTSRIVKRDVSMLH
jgi:hypothetical protein